MLHGKLFILYKIKILKIEASCDQQVTKIYKR